MKTPSRERERAVKKKKGTQPSSEAQATTNAAADERDEQGSVALFPIVGVGASAGGLEAFAQLLAALPRKTGMGFVLVQHLAPDHESALTEILSRATSLPVREITNDERVRVNHVYVIPPDTNLTIAEGVLKIQRPQRTGAPHRSIDTFFESLAQDQRERAVGVVLSGTASDGTMGLEAIKAEGGITFAQDDSAKHDSMPRSAVAAGCVDFILSPADIAKELVRIANHPYVSGQSLLTSATTPAQADQVDAEADNGREEEAGSDNAQDGYKKILRLLRSHSGVDFSLYKPTTIQRRVARRLVLNKQGTLHDYASFLRGNDKELDALYSDVLINVTSFFRNPETFDVLQHKILPELLKQRGDDPLRFWVLACSTGQEAYSIAMAFVEAAEKAPRLRELKVFATDLSERMLEKARRGLYAKSLVADITPQRLQRFFVETDGGYRIDKTVRDMVVFARQNLTADPPFSRVDLISCRNVLIYLEPSAQKKAMPSFHFALKPGGFLLLGASESIGGFTHLFEPVDKKHKIYSKKPASIQALHLPVRTEDGEEPPALRTPVPNRRAGRPELSGASAGELNPQREADRITVSQFAPPGVLVNAELQVLQFRGETGAFLEPPPGRPSFDVLKMARNGLMLPLRSAINQAKKENKTARKENVRVKGNGKTRTVTLAVIPLTNLREPCFLILFEEAEKASGENEPTEPQRTRADRSPRGKEKSRIAELETELSETREYLQSVQEQLETANEEFQASSEEVQSANEELQSSNEELETSKEELESTNEELTTVNDELSNRNVELNRLNSDLLDLQASAKVAIVLLGPNLDVRRFGPHAEKHFHLLVADIGRPIGDIQHNLVLGDASESALDLESLCAEVVFGVREQEREVRDKGGRWYSLRVRPHRTLDNQVDGALIVVVDIDTLKRSEQAVRESEARYRVMFESTNMGVCETDAETGRLLRVNEQFARIIGYTAAELVGKTFLELTHPDDLPESWEDSGSRLLRGEIPFYEIEKRLVRKDETTVWVHVAVNLVRDAASRPLHTVVIALDITERKRREDYHAFLLKLSDTLRPLADPERVQAVAADLLGAHLRVNHSHYGEVRGEYVYISHSYADGLPPMTGSFHADDFGKRAMDGHRAGKLQVSVNTATDPIFSGEERQALKGQHIGAYVTVPLVKEGKWVGTLGVQSIEPREWTPSEIELVQEVAERTWAAVQHAGAAKALRKSEEKYRTLFDSMEEGVATVEVLFDSDDKAVDYVILETNQAHEKMTGMPPAFVGKRVREVMPTIEEDMIERVGRVALTGEPIRFEEYVSALGRWFELSMSRVGGEGSRTVASLANNITERKRREHHAVFLDKLARSLALLENPEEIVRAAGEALGAHLEISFLHLVGVKLNHGDEPSEAHFTVRATWEREGLIVASGDYRAGDYLSTEFLRAARAGETIVIRDTDTDPRVDAEGYRSTGIRGVVVVPILEDDEWPGLIAVGTPGVRDWRPDEVALILEMAHRVFPRVERARADAALRHSQAELTEADRRKDEFIAMLAHELRNPLAALAHGLDLQGKVPGDRARREELRGMMVRQTKRMATLLDQLLDIARVISGKIELSKSLIDLADVVRAAVETVSLLVETQKHKLTLSLPPDKSALVLGDALRLTQVVENLLTNAVKYTNEGGQIALTLESDKGEARIIVRDTGTGIDADFLPRVFEVFAQEPRTLDRAKGGMGLGLALVQRLVDMHEGQVSASSPGLGQGSEFIVTLPRLVERPSMERVAGASTESKIWPRRILIVDDEKDLAELFAGLLADDGHPTLAVNDGPAALVAVRTFVPEVVLLDLGLPKMDGYEVAKRLREEHGDKKILLIALTGYKKDAARLKEAGFDEYLAKPVDREKLSALLAAWDGGRGTP